MKRKMIERKCENCGIVSSIRADGAGKKCRPCRAKENSKNKLPKNIKGKCFGNLKVISLSHINKSAYWNCLCICGRKCIIHSTRLTTNKTKSCGCIVKTQEGKSKCSTYRSWDSMIQRCYDKSVAHFKWYGAKGIIVCDRWKNSFLNFLEDMKERPLEKTLDRIDSSGNYELSNCRWSSVKEQANNTKSNFKISCFGKTQTLTQWANEYNISWSTLRKRIITLKWSIEKSILTPVGKYATKKR